MVFLQPHADVIEEILPDRSAPVVWPRVAPGGRCPVIVVEVDAAAIVLGPAVKLPEIKVTWPQVVIDNVEDHCNAMLMRALDELLECQRTTVVGFNRENMGGVVSPRPFPCKLGDGHDLDRIDAELSEVSQTR